MDQLINLCDKSPTKLCSSCESRLRHRRLYSPHEQYCQEAGQFVSSLKECPITKKMHDDILKEDK